MDKIADFKKRYRYESDLTDRWTLLDGDGIVRGDCEDFTYTVLWLIADKSWMNFWWLLFSCQAMFWRTNIPKTGQPHAMLWVRGYGWIDCNFPAWSPAPIYPKVFPIIAPFIALALAMS